MKTQRTHFSKTVVSSPPKKYFRDKSGTAFTFLQMSLVPSLGEPILGALWGVQLGVMASHRWLQKTGVFKSLSGQSRLQGLLCSCWKPVFQNLDFT